jgi:hypothetical protein
LAKVDNTTITATGGVISAAIGSGITINTTTISGGTTGQLLYDNAGTVGETASFTWSSPNLTLAAATGGIIQAPYFVALSNSGGYAGLFAQVSGDTNHRIVLGTDGANGDTAYFGFGPGNTGFDTFFYREFAGTMSLEASTEATEYRAYKTIDTPVSPTNYERGVFGWRQTANILTIGGVSGGTGAARDVALVVNTAGGSSETLRLLSATSPAGTVKFSNAASFTANGANASTTGNIYITGHTAIIKWLTLVDSGGTTVYVPCY